MAAIFFDKRKDETVIIVEVETSVTVEGQTNTQTATVRQGTQGPKGTSYSEENCHILMYNEDPNLDPYNRTICLQVGNSPALAQKLYIVVVERNSEKSLVIIGSDSGHRQQSVPSQVCRQPHGGLHGLEVRQPWGPPPRQLGDVVQQGPALLCLPEGAHPGARQGRHVCLSSQHPWLDFDHQESFVEGPHILQQVASSAWPRKTSSTQWKTTGTPTTPRRRKGGWCLSWA